MDLSTKTAYGCRQLGMSRRRVLQMVGAPYGTAKLWKSKRANTSSTGA